jgi:protein involved in polysaccharide export with SLBB domain
MKKTTIFLTLLLTTLLAQENDPRSSRDVQVRNEVEQPRPTLYGLTSPSQYISPDNYILDREIDPNTYMLGPGDQLNLHIGGLIQQDIGLFVLPEGQIILPESGSLDIRGLSLAQAEALVLRKYKEVYKTDDIQLNLIRLRSFLVYISGQVENPGSYYVKGIDRVNYLIQLAGGNKREQEALSAGWADLSRVTIKRRDTTLIANLWEFFYRGDLKQNPYLESGDIVNVPSIDLGKPFVIVYSQSGNALYRPVLADETLKEFLDRAGFINARSDIENIKLVRKDSTILVNLEDINRPKIFLERNDEIIVPVLRGEVFVTGEVVNPGPYTYVPDYTAWDYISRAGIIESSTNIKDVQVIRFADSSVETGSHVIVRNGDIVFLGRKSREDFADWAAILTPILTLLLTVYIAVRQ